MCHVNDPPQIRPFPGDGSNISNGSIRRGLDPIQAKIAKGERADAGDLLNYLETNFDFNTFTRQELEALDKLVRANPAGFDAGFMRGWEAVRGAMKNAGPRGLKGKDSIDALRDRVGDALANPSDGYQPPASHPWAPPPSPALPVQLFGAEDPRLASLALEAIRARLLLPVRG